ncbi:MAG TPA: PAS domain S-box protein [Pyrinomonadaceae bacterium]|nr:PAS domain S-box protein [Pyrinomonadaceae bacterium]
MSTLPLQTEQLLARLIDASVEGILAFDRDCRYIAWNSAMERISGMKREEVIGKCAFELFPFLKETGEDKCFYAALEGESASSDNRPYLIPETGREGFFKGLYSSLRDHQNEVIGGIAVIHDITERKRAEESAQEAHKRLTSLVENSPLAVIEWDSDFRVSRWSEAAQRLFGWKAEEVIGKHVGEWHFVFDEDVDAVEQVTNRQRMGAELLGVLHNRNYTKDGSILFCEWYNSVLHDENGNLLSVLSLVLDVTARKLAEEERSDLLVRERGARKQAEEADRLKDEFLATLSHELRTPLTSILGWATLIRNGEVDETNIARAIEIIERNARSQARLIDDLLDVSRIITGNLLLDVHPLNLAPVIDAAKDALRPAADAKGIQVATDFDPASCLVSGDPNRLRQVIWNLLLNAIKFTPRGGSVSIKLACAGSFARLTISDTGEGIGPEFLPYVFHRFRQEEGSISRKAGGLGLGLAVVRHIVELHGGSVTAESPGPGQGSTFTVDLPLAAERRKKTRDATITGEIERRGSGALLRLDGLSLLLVEDDDDSRNLLTMVLERYGAKVISASSTMEAMKAFEGVQSPVSNVQSSTPKTPDPARETPQPSPALPDVVISDIGMPDEDGYAFIRRLRELSPDRGGLIPAIALTGYATSKDRETILASGYQVHLAKPVEPEDVVNAILRLKGERQ